MSTVALATSGGAVNNRRALAPSQSPYFRALFKGELLQPKPGRADDSRWPPPAPPPEQAYVPLAEPLETGATPTSDGKGAAANPDERKPSRRKN